MKILHITYGFNGGGVGFVIANYCTRRPLKNIQFEIVGEDIGKKHLLHDRFERAGFQIHYVTPKKKNLLKNIIQMARLLQFGKYDAVHVHFEEWSFLYLGLAKLYRIPIRIVHAHMAHSPHAVRRPHYRVFRLLLNRWATARMACSQDAGDYLFQGNAYTLLRNAIDVQHYTFQPEIRARVRERMGLDGHFVVGTVGRLSEPKNPLFTVKIFGEICKREPTALLLLVGQGEMESQVRQEVKRLGLQERVQFLGLRTDVPELLQAMDVFLLPSIFEGLGIVYVEAQAAGLQTFASNVVVPKEACMSEQYLHFIGLDEDETVWAEKILACKNVERQDLSALVAEKGYSIVQEVEHLEQYYAQLDSQK